MRNRNLLILVIAIIIAVLIYLLRGCLPWEEGGGAPKPGDPIVAPIAIAFFDAAQATTVNVKDVTITLLDSIGQVRTCNGDSIVSFKLDAGVMCLGIKKGALFSEDAPYSFSFRAEAPDYSPIIQTVVVTKEEPMYIPLFMANIKTPPPGVATSTQQFEAAEATLGQGLRDTIEIPNIGQLRINIPEGTELFFSNGKPARGFKGSLQITFGDPLSEGAARVFPNGPLVTQAMDSNGAILASPDAPIFFQSLGWATIDMRVEGRKVNGFSQDIEIELPVNPDLTGPQGYPYSAGQEVPVWSLDENTGAWKQEFFTTLESQGEFAPLQARIRTNHLSTWNLDFFAAPCPSNLSFTIVNSGCAGMLTSEVALSTGAFAKTNVLSYVAGANPMELLLVPNTSSVGGTLQFRVYDTSVIPPGAAATLATVNLSNCTPSPTSLSILPASTGGAGCDLFALEVSLETATGDVPLCNNALWYKEDSGAADDLTLATWGFAGHFDGSGVVRMTQLDPTKNYRFMVWWGATPASNSIRWSIEAALRTSTNCGATPYNPRLESTFAGLGRQIRKRCYNNSATTCTDSGAGSGGAYNCDISGSNFNSARGVFLRITNFPAAATPPPCS